MFLDDSTIKACLTANISRLAGAASDAGPTCIFLDRPSGLPPYTIMVALSFVVPIPAVNVPSGTIATLFVTDPAGPGLLPVPALLSSRFGLTATEAEVARRVATGRGVAHAAQELRISLNTARTHLKAVYSKTGVNHQAQLTWLIITSFPPVARLGLW